MITAVQFVHESGLLHLDIKPARAHACLPCMHPI
jgi:serine/threonine protein kinase